MMQNLCTMMAGGMCSCCMMMNGMMVCCCNLTMGMCKCEMTEDGVLHHLHQRRRKVLRDDPGLLRLHGRHDEGRLHLLHDDEQHAGLLRHLLTDSQNLTKPEQSDRA